MTKENLAIPIIYTKDIYVKSSKEPDWVESIKDYFDQDDYKGEPPELVQIFTYYKWNGWALDRIKLRLDLKDKTKTFIQFYYNGSQIQLAKGNTDQTLLYNYELVTKDTKKIVFVEGERKADFCNLLLFYAKIQDCVFISYSNAKCFKEPTEESKPLLEEWLQSKDITILVDNDTTGITKAKDLSLSLLSFGRGYIANIVNPGLFKDSKGFDIVDWLLEQDRYQILTKYGTKKDDDALDKLLSKNGYVHLHMSIDEYLANIAYKLIELTRRRDIPLITLNSVSETFNENSMRLIKDFTSVEQIVTLFFKLGGIQVLRDVRGKEVLHAFGYAFQFGGGLSPGIISLIDNSSFESVIKTYISSILLKTNPQITEHNGRKLKKPIKISTKDVLVLTSQFYLTSTFNVDECLDSLLSPDADPFAGYTVFQRLFEKLDLVEKESKQLYYELFKKWMCSFIHALMPKWGAVPRIMIILSGVEQKGKTHFLKSIWGDERTYVCQDGSQLMSNAFTYSYAMQHMHIVFDEGEVIAKEQLSQLKSILSSSHDIHEKKFQHAYRKERRTIFSATSNKTGLLNTKEENTRFIVIHLNKIHFTLDEAPISEKDRKNLFAYLKLEYDKSPFSYILDDKTIDFVKDRNLKKYSYETQDELVFSAHLIPSETKSMSYEDIRQKLMEIKHPFNQRSQQSLGILLKKLGIEKTIERSKSRYTEYQVTRYKCEWIENSGE